MRDFAIVVTYILLVGLGIVAFFQFKKINTLEGAIAEALKIKATTPVPPVETRPATTNNGTSERKVMTGKELWDSVLKSVSQIKVDLDLNRQTA